MRSSILLVGLLLVSPVVYAQRAPAASATPAPVTHSTPTSSPSISPSSSSASSASHSASPSPSSSSSSASSSSSSSHSGGGGFSPSTSHSSGSVGGSSSGMSSGASNRHERERDSSRDSSSAGGHGSSPAAGSSNSASSHSGDPSPMNLPSARDTKRDTFTPGRHDPGQDNIRRGQGAENAPNIDAKIDAKVNQKIDAKIAGPHERDAAPQLSQSDWRLGRCQEGPCEPCPTGTSPTKYGNCVANARPAAAPPSALCTQGRVWNGTSCVSEYAAGLASSRASASRCLYYFSESNRLSSNVRSARQKETEECFKDSKGAKCSFAHMDVMTAESACSLLVAEAPAACQSQVSSCL